MSVLEVERLGFGYGREPVFSGLDFAFEAGRAVAVVGANGAGKTTLLKLIAGLLRPQEGGVRWRGQCWRGTPPGTAYLPQREEIDRGFPITVRGIVEMGRYPALGIWRRFSRSDAEAVERALAGTGMSGHARARLGGLSGGQQQRAFIARALAQDAGLLILDEPFTGLDRTMTGELACILKDLAAQGRLILASHHDLSSVADIYDDVIMLHRGLVAAGPVRKVFNDANIHRALGLPPHVGTDGEAGE